MAKTLLISVILFLLFSAPGIAGAQAFGGHGFVNPLVRAPIDPMKGRLDIHTNPSDDHFAFESLERHSYQYEALHNYEHYRGEGLRQFDRFRDIQYPKNQPYDHSPVDRFFDLIFLNPFLD
jgi:hypothetical protein